MRNSRDVLVPGDEVRDTCPRLAWVGAAVYTCPRLAWVGGVGARDASRVAVTEGRGVARGVRGGGRVRSADSEERACRRGSTQRASRAASGTSHGGVASVVVFASQSKTVVGLWVMAARCRESIALTAKARARSRKERERITCGMYGTLERQLCSHISLCTLSDTTAATGTRSALDAPSP